MRLIQLIWLRLQIMALQATAQGQLDALPMIRCEETRNRIILAHLNALAEIDRMETEFRRVSRGRGIQSLAV